MKFTHIKTVLAAKDGDVYIGWFSVEGKYAYVYAALWLQAGSQTDFDKAKKYVQKEYGDNGLVTFMPFSMDIKEAKKQVRKMVLKKVEPGLKVIEEEGELGR